MNHGFEPARDYLTSHNLLQRLRRKRSVAPRVCFEFRGTVQRLPFRLVGLPSIDSYRLPVATLLSIPL